MMEWDEERLSEDDWDYPGEDVRPAEKPPKTLLDCLEHGGLVLQGLPSSLETAKALSPPQGVTHNTSPGKEPGMEFLEPPLPLYPYFWAVRNHRSDRTGGGSYIPVGPGVDETVGQSPAAVETLWWRWVWTAVVEPQPGQCSLDELLTAWGERWVDFPELYSALCSCLQAGSGHPEKA